jgi:hypothetical protein
MLDLSLTHAALYPELHDPKPFLTPNNPNISPNFNPAPNRSLPVAERIGSERGGVIIGNSSGSSNLAGSNRPLSAPKSSGENNQIYHNSNSNNNNSNSTNCRPSHKALSSSNPSVASSVSTSKNSKYTT